MNFTLDENMPTDLVDDLRAAGHAADTVHDQGMTGNEDSILLWHVGDSKQVLFTMEKGIADVRIYPPRQYSGIVLFRPKSTGRRTVLAFVRRHLASLLQADLAGRLLVVSDAGIRIR